MSRFDWFVGHLECPHCRAISAADASTGMYTYLRDLEDEYATISRQIEQELELMHATADTPDMDLIKLARSKRIERLLKHQRELAEKLGKAA